MHYSLLVIDTLGNQDIEDMLEPYDSEPRSEYLEFDMDLPEEKMKSFAESLSLDSPAEYKAKWDRGDVFGILSDYFGGYYNEQEHGWGKDTNPNAFWDWYVVGGRWRDYFKPVGVDSVKCIKEHIDVALLDSTYAILSDGDLITSESFPTEEEWSAKFKEVLLAIPDTSVLTIVDYHN